ncbi:MAG: aldolase catalytic domain-containing protein [bacterium]|jgi:4-hydroxy 2-oxovalerate aldolase|nr:aldolase catalytic domain-containing protein [bacterium]
MPETAPWITYRPAIKVLDCTIRDGGLINDSQFPDEFVKAVYEACVDAGIDYMEIGYKNSPKVFSKDKYGPWRHCEEEAIRRIVGDNPTDLKISVMADAGGKCDWEKGFLPQSESVIDLVRVACYAHQISEAVEMIHHFSKLGYETTCNIMAISTTQDVEIIQALDVAANSPVGTVVIVDSFGALYSEQIRNLMFMYKKGLEGTGKEIGLHMHNNQQLAFSNTIEGIIHGANRIDATIQGMGRGAGNCPMELLLGFLRNPKYKIRPIWQIIEKEFFKLRGVMEWGPLPQYIMAGQYNQHPRSAMAARDDVAKRDLITEFFDKCITDI